jgi:hypothetical protein
MKITKKELPVLNEIKGCTDIGFGCPIVDSKVAASLQNKGLIFWRASNNPDAQGWWHANAYDIRNAKINNYYVNLFKKKK